ncbi:MAG: uncharacterized protein KVP18_000285 [Porospora cf. gigantea A]|uniref:uncharacterized protein n=1 Tax=Porospora cf. gigantea A TaxID=2853593 RepID=UPI00355A7F85|nr:MAG: hypothetical protein KVP18_000285 [Porospora cf. gigantea A]
MKAVAFSEFGDVDVLRDVDMPVPKAVGSDVLVKIWASGVNPIDYKMRSVDMGIFSGEKILGYDGVGQIIETGEDVVGVQVGDEVMFAGDWTRNGTNAEFCLVDHRLVGPKPKSLTAPQAASLPLVVITAWEGIAECMHVDEQDKGKWLLALPGAGGVGSMVIQLAKLFGLRVVATASRDITIKWCKDLGADHVINHKSPLREQLTALGLTGVDYIFNAFPLEDNYAQYVDILLPFGHIVNIDSAGALDQLPLFLKRASLSHELMFARPQYGVKPEKQGAILHKVAALVDDGKIKPITTQELPFSLEGVKDAHLHMLSRSACGKTALCML